MIKDKISREESGNVIKQDMLGKRVKYAFIAIGSNLGNRIFNIEFFKLKLQNNFVHIVNSASNYETNSWPDSSKPKFINTVIKIKTVLTPNNLLRVCNQIEKELGRKRCKKNEPRTCDIDIIDYNHEIIKMNNSFDLTLPHPRLELRNFVLLPLFEISKNWNHPVNKLSIIKLISFLKDEDLRAIKKI